MKIDFKEIKDMLQTDNLSEVSRQTGIPLRTLENYKHGYNKSFQNMEDTLTKLQDYINQEEKEMKTLKFKALIKGNKSPVEIKVGLSKNAPKEIYYKLKSELSDTYDLEEMTGLAIEYYGKRLEDFKPREWLKILDHLIDSNDQHKYNFLIEIDGKEYPTSTYNSRTNELVYRDGDEFKNMSL